MFIVEIQWNHFFYYKFPDALLVMGLEFGPKRVQVGSDGLGFEPVLETSSYADERQGLTLVHFSAQLEPFLWDRGCVGVVQPMVRRCLGVYTVFLCVRHSSS